MNRATILGGGSGWTPRSPGAPLFWLDSTFGIPAGTTALSPWPDESGTTNGFAQATASARPTYGGTSWNSARPGVTFDGSNDVLGLVNSYPNGTDRPVTIFATLNATGGRSHTLLQWYDNPTISTVYSFGIDASNHLTCFNGTLTTGTISASGARRVAIFAGTGTVTTYVDSTLDINGSAFLATLGSINTCLLGGNAIATIFFAGVMAEIVVYPIKLAPSAYISGYLPYSTKKFG